MTVLEKVLFLQKSYNLGDRAFCSKFRIKYGMFKKWKANLQKPETKHFVYLCSELELDIEDFMSEKSTLMKDNIKDGEHLCACHMSQHQNGGILEDFPIEDNSRYEEKD